MKVNFFGDSEERLWVGELQHIPSRGDFVQFGEQVLFVSRVMYCPTINEVTVSLHKPF